MRKFYFLIFLIVFCQVQSILTTHKEDCRAWKTFLRTYNKIYESGAEYKHRKQIFLDNLKLIGRLNRSYKRQRMNFSCAVNIYADLTKEEFRKKLSGFKFQGIHEISSKASQITTKTAKAKGVLSKKMKPLPQSKDWRPNAVTSVKHQGKCGSCWSFASVASLEGHISIKYDRLVSLSMQNLIDCVHTEETNGCNGGNMLDAFEWIQMNGIMNDTSYRYVANDTGKCLYDAQQSVGSCVGYEMLPSGSEEKLQEAIAYKGPVAIGIDASIPSLQFYKKGIYYEKNCSSEDINHAVTVVGYGSSGVDQDYWIIKNSWGSGWGEKGFFRLARNKNNHCGVSTYACYPVV